MLRKAELSCEADSKNYLGGSSETICITSDLTSLSTVRSKRCEKIRSRFLRGQGRNALPCCGAGTLNLRLNSTT